MPPWRTSLYSNASNCQTSLSKCSDSHKHDNMELIWAISFSNKNNANKDGWQEQVEWNMQSHCLVATHEYFSNNNITQSPVSRLTYTASPAGLRIPLALESHTGVMAMAPGVSAWTPFMVFLDIYTKNRSVFYLLLKILHDLWDRYHLRWSMRHTIKDYAFTQYVPPASSDSRASWLMPFL